MIPPSSGLSLSKLWRREPLIASVVLAGFLALLCLTPFDRAISLYLADNPWPLFADIMNRSIFEEEALGATDIAVFLQIAALVVYALSLVPGPPGAALAPLRPFVGFVVVSGLLINLGLAHGLKIVSGRVRPFAVLRGDYEFTPWWQFGPLMLDSKHGLASFPSAHTLELLSLLTVGYWFAGHPNYPAATQRAGRALIVIIVMLGFVMAAARCMSAEHWITDCVFSIAVGWIGIHAIYYYLLDLPSQLRGRRGRPGFRYAAWELRVAVYGLVAIAGFGMVAIILRGAAAYSPPMAAAALVLWGAAAVFAASRLGPLRGGVLKTEA